MSSAWPASPARRARPPSRTSARTARRSPPPSPRSSPTTAGPARRSPSTNEECVFSYRHSRFKADPERYVVLRVRFGLEDADGLSGPVRYAETARVLGVAPGDRVPLPTARETVLKLRAGKGMVLDPEDHDTWSAGSFFTNPILTGEEFTAFRTRAKQHLGLDAEPPGHATSDVACDCRLVAAFTTSFGPMIHPTRQPVIAYVFATPLTTMDLSRKARAGRRAAR
ncbi:UDP-N-acetylenolpyruvoylglucosamine reductase [Streptomyces badius]